MNVSSVKNLNGETFSAVQDATLTDVVQSNSAAWSQGGESELEFVDYGTQNQFNINGTKPVYCRIPASAFQIDERFKPTSGYFYLPYNDSMVFAGYLPFTGFDTDVTLMDNGNADRKKSYHLNARRVNNPYIEGYGWDISAWSNEVTWDSIQDKPNLNYFQNLYAGDVTLVSTESGDLNILSGLNFSDGRGYVTPSGDESYTVSFASSCVLKSDSDIYRNHDIGVGFFTNSDVKFFWDECPTRFTIQSDTLQTMLSSGTTLGDLLLSGTNTACGSYGPFGGILFGNTKLEAMDIVISAQEVSVSSVSVKDKLATIPENADEAIQYVQTNSGTIDDTVTAFQTNSSTYMVEPNLEYNAVNEISAYNGSAISQYGAEKQWLVHDDTIVHISNSAQYAFGCNVSALQRLMGIDETVLYSGAATNNGSLNESVENFDTIKVNYITDDGMQGVTEFMPSYTKSISLDSMYVAQNSAVWFKATNYTFTANTSFSSYPYQLFKANNAITATWSNNTANSTFRITRVIGIGRKQ